MSTAPGPDRAALRRAVEALCSDGLLTDWVLVTAHHRVGPDGREETAVRHHTDRVGQPVHHTVGLLAVALDQIRARTTRP